MLILKTLCKQAILNNDPNDRDPITTCGAAYLLCEWQNNGGELAEATANITLTHLAATYNYALSELATESARPNIIRQALATMKFDVLVEAWNEFVRTVNELQLNYLPRPPFQSYYIRPMSELDKEFDGCSATYILDTLDHVIPHDLYYYQCDDPLADAYDNYASCSIPNNLDDFPYWNHLDDIIRYILDTGDTLHSDEIAKALDTIAKL